MQPWMGSGWRKRLSRPTELVKTPQPTVRGCVITVKKACYVLIIVFVLFSLIGCSGTKAEQKVANASWYIYSYDQMLELSDIIAEVEITGKSNEIDTGTPRTIFKAKIIDMYKGVDDQVKEINIAQIGNSKTVFRDYDLFKKNDKMVLFLEKAKIENVEDVYVIVGSIGGTFCLESVEGEDYILQKIAPIPQMKQKENLVAENKIKTNKGLKSEKLQVIKKKEFKKQILDDLAKKVKYD